MKILSAGLWRDGYLDYHRREGEYRIHVLAFQNLERLADLYFVRGRNWHLIANYLREIGVRQVIRKVISRHGERLRNAKFLSVGIGRIIETDTAAAEQLGKLVAFIAPCHPQCVERLVLPPLLTFELQTSFQELQESSILYLPVSETRTKLPWWHDIAGWTPFSGRALPPARSLMECVVPQLLSTEWGAARRLPITSRTPVLEQRSPRQRTPTALRPGSVLVGYGNYAKTIIIPGVRDFLSVECIHEIDPTQIPASGGLVTSWDTAPCPREGQHFDVWLIAGYHHTHAPLAIRALRSGAYAVVEKPIVTDEEQLSDLSAALKESPRLFSGYHKRYSPMNEWARRDLGVEAGQPISYHCIVYEVPLPRQHWYRWPNSKSRLVSNGCHWIDHFLYLNAFAAVGESSVTIAPDGTINCSVALQNGAFFTMVLTDKGSSRIGVQEFVELRANDVTVQMMNGSRYVAQGRDSIIRRRRLHKYSGFVGMYHTIGRAIRERQEGDSVLSVQVSARLILELEQKLELQLSEREREGAVPPIESYSG